MQFKDITKYYKTYDIWGLKFMTDRETDRQIESKYLTQFRVGFLFFLPLMKFSTSILVLYLSGLNMMVPILNNEQ